MSSCCWTALFLLSGLTLWVDGGLWEMNITTGVGDWTVTFPPSLTLPSLAHHSSVTSLKRLVSLSLRVFVYRWAAGTPWHAGGLPMRLDGYSDATAWPDDLWKPQAGAGKGIFSAAQMSHWGPVCSPELLCFSHVCFSVKISGLLVLTSDSETCRKWSH